MTVVRLVSLNKRNFNIKRERVVFMVVVPVILVLGLVCSGVATYLEVAHGKGWGVFEVADLPAVFFYLCHGTQMKIQVQIS